MKSRGTSLSALGWSATVRYDGRCYSADCHYAAWVECLLSRGWGEEEAHLTASTMESLPEDEGFTGPDGVFRTREETMRLWRELRAVPEKLAEARDWADSEDMLRLQA